LVLDIWQNSKETKKGGLPFQTNILYVIACLSVDRRTPEGEESLTFLFQGQ
jgi:hypothetical protein